MLRVRSQQPGLPSQFSHRRLRENLPPNNRRFSQSKTEAKFLCTHENTETPKGRKMFDALPHLRSKVQAALPEVVQVTLVVMQQREEPAIRYRGRVGGFVPACPLKSSLKTVDKLKISLVQWTDEQITTTFEFQKVCVPVKNNATLLQAHCVLVLRQNIPS